jgi:hypothetical protein
MVRADVVDDLVSNGLSPAQALSVISKLNRHQHRTVSECAATIKRLDDRSNSGSVPQHMKRELKPEEQIVRAVAAGDRIKATNIYLSATEGNLTDAQNYVKTLTAEAEAAESERSSKKSP